MAHSGGLFCCPKQEGYSVPNLPATVDIFGKPYRIEPTVGEGRDYGECYVNECRIEVWTIPVMHEVMHAIDHELHCSLSEPQIRRMATGILAVLRHNPALVAYLMEP